MIESTNGLIIVNRIDEQLKSKGLKRANLCKDLNIASSTISTWATRGTIPPADTLLKIAEYLEVDLYFLITGINKNKDQDFILDFTEERIIKMYRELQNYEKKAIERLIKALFDKVDYIET